MRYRLDTNVVSDLVRNPQGQVTQRIREVGKGSSLKPAGTGVEDKPCWEAGTCLMALFFPLPTAGDEAS